MIKAWLAANPSKRDYDAIDVFKRTMVRTIMGKLNGKNTLLETHQVHAFMQGIAIAHSQGMKATVTGFHEPHRLEKGSEGSQSVSALQSSGARTPSATKASCSKSRFEFRARPNSDSSTVAIPRTCGSVQLWER